MNLHKLYAPQLGEGVKDIKITSVLKNIGDSVRKDEPILVVETEKAAMEIESPVDGILHFLNVHSETKVAVGQEMLAIQINSSKAATASIQAPPPSFLATRTRKLPELKSNRIYSEKNISERQLSLIQKMRSSQSESIPAFIESSINSKAVQIIKERYRATYNDGKKIPSLTEIVSWSVLQTMKAHPRFRSEVRESCQIIREHACSSIGIAVGLPEDEMTTILVKEEECADFDIFCSIYKQRLTETRQGIHHSGMHLITISNLAAHNVHSAVPVIVYPSIATLCVGISPDRNLYTLSLSFDHRIINGVGAASFLSKVNGKIQNWFKYVELQPSEDLK
jgi:2-oxoisovalerate dehydrogenase E1 component